ncbi:MAG TPA: 3-hydroxyacyl-CoA dehydrogenase NAD-binding domain-containing protein [Gaiellaceae bacterium]|nr:3-hydroxyacyl-CoA dehydrogenase NAD-binding domain-containing protein [Gaiellaceae bacterium]
MADTVFKLARVSRSDVPSIALVTIDNGADHTQPTFFGRAALRSLEAVLGELESDDWSALVITGKPYFFSTGADVNEFTGATAELAREGSRVGHELFGRIRALPYPTVAAINGACLGGGVELALHCDFRTISSAVRHFACPEVFLGIIPAWGGTQLVTRLVGVETAVRFIVENPLRQNRLLDGRAADELGFADRLLGPIEFLDESIDFATELGRRSAESASGAENGVRPQDRAPADIIRKARAQLDDSIHGAAPAPYRALELIEGAASGWSLDDGYRAEEDAVAELLPGRQAQASLYAFDLVERRAKKAPELGAEPRALKKVGIVGAGLMATQLATLFLRRLELPLVLRDIDEQALERARDAIEAELAGLVAKGRYDEGKARFLASLVTTTTGYDEFADCDLVLEAVFEELEVKRDVFGNLEAVGRPDTVFATNTSALSVTQMAAGLEHPERVVGLHFFNPVALLPLVELVRAERTDDATLATAWSAAENLRKRPVLVADAPAFVVNRVLTRLLTVVLGAVERGNTVEEADEAILRLGLPMAPSVLLQMVGPTVALHVLETLHEAYPDRFPLSQTLANYAQGREEIASAEHDPLSPDEILRRALEGMADEVRHLLDEGVVAGREDVDTALILGAGFPFWLGGITKYLEQTGVSGERTSASA